MNSREFKPEFNPGVYVVHPAGIWQVRPQLCATDATMKALAEILADLNPTPFKGNPFTMDSGVPVSITEKVWWFRWPNNAISNVGDIANWWLVAPPDPQGTGMPSCEFNARAEISKEDFDQQKDTVIPFI